MENDFVTFRMRDNDCHICKRENAKWSGLEVVFTHEGLRIVVEVCWHCTHPVFTARGIVEDYYDAWFVHKGISKTAFSSGSHHYSWSHLEREARQCIRCACEDVPILKCIEVRDWFYSAKRRFDQNGWCDMGFEDLSNELRERFSRERLCKACFHVVSKKFQSDALKEIKKWHELQQLQKNERESVLKVKELLIRAKRALRMTTGRQDALRLLKTEFEQVATSHK